MPWDFITYQKSITSSIKVPYSDYMIWHTIESISLLNYVLINIIIITIALGLYYLQKVNNFFGKGTLHLIWQTIESISLFIFLAFHASISSYTIHLNRTSYTIHLSEQTEPYLIFLICIKDAKFNFYYKSPKQKFVIS